MNVTYAALAVIRAWPDKQAPGQSGQNSFCSDESGVVRRDTAGAVQVACATSGLPPLQ
jgi:hypothetical protein